MSNAVLPVYGPSPVVFERGEGVRMYDDKGKPYLDFIAGIAVNALGHCHPVLVKALSEQANKLWHTSNMFRVPGQERLAQRYVDLTFADFAFFTNSGAESIEGCIKIARRYQWSKGFADRIGILSFEGSFHGRTLGGINAGAQEKYREGFGPRLPGFRSIAWEDVEALKAEIVKPDLAAVVIEPVQGEGGVREASHDFLRTLQMTVSLAPFDAKGRKRITQLINKTNQFNLTTRRYTEAQVAGFETSPSHYTLQVSASDRFGDNGMISVIIFDKGADAWVCDTWLMSCRVLGRRVEEAALATIAAAARAAGAKRLVGHYLPSAKNKMVANHFSRLGFALLAAHDDGRTEWALDLADYAAPELPMQLTGSGEVE